MSVSSYASYTESQLETSHYVDATDASNYYFLYNNPVQQNSGMIDDGENEKYKSGKKVDTNVTLTGDGIPYMLDAWTGEITPIADYTVNGDGTITTHINLSGGESTWIAITNDTLKCRMFMWFLKLAVRYNIIKMERSPCVPTKLEPMKLPYQMDPQNLQPSITILKISI